jgi:hypothetical protein
MLPSWRVADPALALAAAKRRLGRPPAAVPRPRNLPGTTPA